MPQANSGTNATKEIVQEVNANDVDQTEGTEPKAENLIGDGASDKMTNAPNRHDLKAEDREKDGSKVPDAMGAGNY